MTSSGWVSIYDEAALAPVSAANPTGTIIFWGGGGTGAVIPTGYLECDFAAKSRTTFAALFAVIGTKYGAGDGSTTFNVPASDQCVPFGIASTVNTRATTIASGTTSVTHTHTIASSTLGNESATHTHTHLSSTLGNVSADHSHNITALSLNNNSANHSHNFSDFYNTGTEHTGKVTNSQNANHNHTLISGSTSGISANHNHAINAMALNNASASHNHAINAATLNNASADHTHNHAGIAGTYLIKT